MLFLVLLVADIMMQESLHDTVSERDLDAPVSSKVNMQSHFNTLAITAPKEAFHKSALLGFPHIKPDFQGHKQENIKRTLKKLWSDKTQHKGAAAHVLKEPISNFVNFQKSLLVDFSNVTTISSSHLGAAFQESSFTTPLPDTRQVKESTAKSFTNTSYRVIEKDLQSSSATDKPSQRTPATTASMYVPVNSHQTSNINTPDTNVPATEIQSVTFMSKALYEASTISSPASSSFGFTAHFLKSTSHSTVSSNCRGLCDISVTSSSTTERTSPHTEVLTVPTQPTSDVPQREATNQTNKVTNGFSRLALLSQFLRNTTLSTTIDYRQENERSNGSEPTHTLDSPAWNLEIPRLPTRKHRPVCLYPPVPSHGTFYFRSIQNPGPHQYKHYIQYACYPGYTLTSGDVYSYCRHNGQWSGKTPLCLGKTLQLTIESL